MRNYFTFGNYDSRDFGVYISGEGTYDAPARVYDAISVPGRNGDLLINREKFGNITVTYPAFIAGANFRDKLASFRSAMLSTVGYARLVDTYHPEEFRLAYFGDSIKVDARSQNDGGEFDIIFNCKPQRFLTSGETSQAITNGGNITNPTLFDSKPLIRVTGYGTLTIGSDVITIASGQSYVDIDSETQDCYTGTENKNSKVTFQSNNFPVLPPGDTGITWTGSITRVTITPRWWRI